MAVVIANTDIAALQRAEEKRYQGNAALAFAKDVKNSLLFKYDWSELLSAAPLCISLMGSCYVAATTEKAYSIELSKPQNGFQYINHPRLRACLIQVADQGTIVFVKAEKQMALIASECPEVGKALSSCGEYLAQLPNKSAELYINDSLDKVRKGADLCLQQAKLTEKDFVEWLKLVMEVHQCCAAKEDQAGGAAKDAEISIAGLTIEEELTSKSAAEAEEAAKAMKKNMDDAKKLAEKAAKAVPSPLAAIGIQLLDTTAQAVGTIIAQGLPKLAEKIVGAFNKPAAGGKPPPSTGTANTNVEDASDPAYRAAVQARVATSAMTLLVGTDPKPDLDWEALDPPDAATSRSGLVFVETTINFILTNTTWTNNNASVELKRCLDQIISAISEIKTASAARKKDLNSALKPGSLQAWRSTATASHSVVVRLATTASSQGGAAPGSAPLFDTPPASQAAQNRTGQMSAVQAASEKARIQAANYTAAQANFVKVNETRAKVQSDLARIKKELSNMNQQKMSLEEIKKILRQCIGTLIQMKAQITNLVNFFTALSAMIEHVVGTTVKDFLQQAGRAQEFLIAGISLLDTARRDLYTSILTTQAYFSVFRLIADKYTTISVEWIKPGIVMCSELSKTVSAENSGDNAITRLRKLDEFTTGAQDAVKKIVTEFQAKTSKELGDRVTAAAGVTSILPPAPLQIEDSIKEGQKKTSDALIAGAEAYAETRSKAFQGVSSDDI